jgi:DNA-binding NtrC family response regulator
MIGNNLQLLRAMARTVLIVEDDAALLNGHRGELERAGWTVQSATSAQEGRRLAGATPPAVILVDLAPSAPGAPSLLPALQRAAPAAAIVLLTGPGDLSATLEALRLGAEDFLLKPAAPAALLTTLEKAYQASQRRLAGGVRETASGWDESKLHTSCPTMRSLVREARLLAESGLTVVLLGESGTGKNWLARKMHDLSPRGDHAFVGLNCAGLNATFLESELFGHERGAFTDAKHQKPGLMEVAHQGTLFLDEIGDLALEIQPKILHVLESGRFRRMGGTQELEVDVRLIAATNQDLQTLVRSGSFREDLYYRLNVATLRLPPLRERGSAYRIRLAEQIFVELRSQRLRGPTRISPEALNLIDTHPWPGNIRELRNVLERALALGEDEGQIRPRDLPLELRDTSASLPTTPLRTSDAPPSSLREMERRHIEATLDYFRGNRTRAAEALGISRVGLYKKLLRIESELEAEGVLPTSPYLRRAPRG